MQRVKIFGGRISWPQWRGLARLAEQYTPQAPLHLTTRQDIEFHNVAATDLSALQAGLSAIGLGTFGAGGDSVRNITVCPYGQPGHGLDVYGVARFIDEQLGLLSFIDKLPRKFKISFSACSKAGAKPFINDLGFVLQPNGAFTVIGAGSLGPKPGIGIELYRDLALDDVLPLCRAAIEFFNDCGDRENRRRARFRHVRQRLGDEAFKAELHRRFLAFRETAKKHMPQAAKPGQTLEMIARLQLPNGDIMPDDAIELADAAEPPRLELRINLSHGLELFSKSSIVLELPPKLAALTNLPAIVACPGCRTCPNGLTDCGAMAEKLRERLSGTRSDKVIAISGCPNDCAQAVVANVGLLGLIRTIDGQRRPCYRVLTGGENGTTATLGQERAVLAEDAAADYVKSVL